MELRALSPAGWPSGTASRISGTDLADLPPVSFLYLIISHPLARQIRGLLMLVDLEETQELSRPLVVADQLLRGALPPSQPFFTP